ncbi:hypothetical protein O181_043888 [Austropuccinia psidii MF-1]|uniref:Uncharacterized protein n=1 Tax=Austropuccinia psidii MF-1 TaxID=1389203 RepID=A0A9Q3HG53_9BASI|nr:hypothetical protein [Austropuccinia psidii MF-1]
MTPSEIRRVVDVNQIKCIHFGHVAIFSSTGLLIALVEFRPFTPMSEVEVKQWDELSQFLFLKKRFTDSIATNGALLKGFMFAIRCHKCSMKNELFGLYGSVGKIENTKDEWQNRGANHSLVGCILVSYEGNIPANQGACEFASTLTFTMNGFQNSPHLDKDALLFLTVQAIPYACAGSENAKNSLRLCRLPKIHTPILTLVKIPDNAENFLRLCRLPKIHTPILTLVKLPGTAKNSLCLCRLLKIHTPTLTLVKVPDNLNSSIHY